MMYVWCADDIIIVAKSKEELEEMMKDIEMAPKEVGLEMHTGKTKVITNGIARNFLMPQKFLLTEF